MNKNAGSLYIPMEDILYALSVLSGYQTGAWNFRHRLYALTEFVDNLILANEIITDVNREYSHDRNLLDLLNYYQLEKVVRPKDAPLLNFADFVPGLKEVDFSEELSETGLTQIFQSTEFVKNGQIDENTKKWFSMLYSAARSNEDFTQKNIRVISDFLLTTFKYDHPYNNFSTLLEYVSRGMSIAEFKFKQLFAEFDLNIPDNILLENDNQFLYSRFVIPMFGSMFWSVAESGLSYAQEYNSAYRPYSLLSQVIRQRPIFAPSSKVFLDKLETEKHKELVQFNDFLYDKYTRVIRLPILFDYVLLKAGSPKEVVKVALDLREEKFVRDYRKWCKELDDALIQGNQFESLRMIAETERYIANITKHLSLIPEKVDVQVSFPPAVIFEVPTSGITRKDHLIFLEKVYRGSLNPLIHKEKISNLFGFDIE